MTCRGGAGGGGISRSIIVGSCTSGIDGGHSRTTNGGGVAGRGGICRMTIGACGSGCGAQRSLLRNYTLLVHIEDTNIIQTE